MIVLVAGGTGFLGSHVVKILESHGHEVIIYNTKEKAVPTYADVIVNCVGILSERSYTFKEVHVDLTQWLLTLGKKLHVQQFVQVSALGVHLDGVPYQRTKRQAEILVESSGLPYAIIRPSMLFGKRDKSINLFRTMIRTGFFPLFANGNVQPVAVETAAGVIVAAAERRIKNKSVEVGGPEIFTYKSLAARLHPGVTVVPIPLFLQHVLYTFNALFPFFPTEDMIDMMHEDNSTKEKTVYKLGIENPHLQ